MTLEIHKGIVIEGGDLKTSHEEAGIILVQQMMFAATENQESGYSHC